MQYICTPYHCIAFNHKVASESICEAVVRRFYPDRVEHMQEGGFWRSLVDLTERRTKPAAMLFRDPVDRFLSTYCMMVSAGNDYLSIDDLLEEAYIPEDPRLVPQIGFINEGTITAFRYTDKIPEFCEYVGLPALPHNNVGTLRTPTLTNAQRSAIIKYYHDDYDFYNSLSWFSGVNFQAAAEHSA